MKTRFIGGVIQQVTADTRLEKRFPISGSTIAGDARMLTVFSVEWVLNPALVSLWAQPADLSLNFGVGRILAPGGAYPFQYDNTQVLLDDGFAVRGGGVSVTDLIIPCYFKREWADGFDILSDRLYVAFDTVGTGQINKLAWRVHYTDRAATTIEMAQLGL